MILKELRQLRRDRRTVALMVFLPVTLLVVFGYAARFDVTSIDTVVLGPAADEMADQLPPVFQVDEVDATGGLEDGEDQLRRGEFSVAVVTNESGPAVLLVDGTELFLAQSALRRLPDGAVPRVLFNPGLDTATVMVPSLIGLIMLFIGTVITSLGVVREREQGTLEQLAVMPLRPIDVTVGKIAPYFLVALFDMALVTTAGLLLFDVPFVGSVVMFALYCLVFLFVVLGLGVAISTVSQSQGEAIQLAIMTLLPQVMLSGMIFPLESMAAGVRWIGYLFPLTYFVTGMRGILLRGSPAEAVAVPLLILVAMAVVVFGVAVLRFRRDLAPRITSTSADDTPGAEPAASSSGTGTVTA
jgi:ABC-2 type transport system permease protein